MGNQQGKERRDCGRKIDWTTAECPSPPGKPYLVPELNEKYADIITIRWSPPSTDGGAPILGYLVEHRRTGSPHWLRATPHLVPETILPLTGLEPGWRYQFRVSAENEVGRSMPGELSEPLTVTPQKWAASAPFFNVELQDKIGLENEKVEFKVQVIGIPPPTISWYKDGFELFSSRRTKIVTEDDRSTFIIHQAALEDEGEIKCTATNRAGHAVTKANLKLEAPPRIRLPRKYEDGLIFEKGEPIRLKVTVAGRPRPQVSWYHNGEILEKSARIDIVDSKTSSMLKIADACRNDRGEYMILGVNKIGDNIASFLVTVTDRPQPPGKIHIKTTGCKATLTWSSPDDDGGCKIGTYIIEYFRVGWDMWLKAKNSRQLTTSIENLIEGSEYRFRVRAENPYGISDPSEESEIIFIPDSKRGSHQPSLTMNASSILKESKRPIEKDDREDTEESKKRRLLEEKAKKLLDTPMSELLPYENAKPEKRKAESSPETTFFDIGTESIPPSVPRRKNQKEKRINLNSTNNLEQNPMLINSQRKSSTDKISDEKTSNCELNVQNLNILETVDGKEVDKTLNSQHANDKHLVNEQETFSFESPLYPRETDDNIIHGSSEIMLVIYPPERSKSLELSAQQRSEIEMNLREEGIAPPMSLSSPELGAGVFELPPLRDAISSTELLYERTAARLYQNAMEEEEQRVVRRRYSADRKSVERRASLKEALIERRRSFKENEEEETSERPKLEQNKIETANESAQKFYLTIPISNAGRERLSSVEKEQLEFALIREKLQKKEEERQALSTSVQHLSDTTTTTSSSFEGIDAEDEEYEDEYLEEEEEESYLEDIQKDLEEHEKEEKLDAPMANIYKFKESKIPIREVLPSLKPNKMAPFAVAESDTCTPKSMIPTRSVLSRIQNISEGKALKELKASPKVEKKELLNISKIPVSAPKKAKKASKLLRKFGLKKEKKLLEEIPVDPNLPPPPKPILKNKTMAKTKNSPIKRLNLSVSKLAEKSISEEESENDLAGRKKKVRISEPDTQSKIAKEIQKSEDENTVENQVLIYHYSDIVKEFGGGKKPPAKLYLNYDELKAHAKPEDPSEKTNPRPKNLEKIEPSNLKQMPATDNADEVEEIRKEASRELSQELPEEDHQEKTIEQSSPSSSAISNLESKIYFSLEYATDVAMFIFACWLYFFKSEIYAIPVLCIMAYRQLKEITLKKYKKLIDTISKKIPQVIKKKTETNKNS